jgi:glycosyltransferase involved in cell wall biosynthesis
VHLRHATLIIAISRFVADQLIALGMPAERIEVVWNGIAVERPRLATPASMDLVMLARHDKNKNVAYVMRAFGLLLERQPNWPGRLLVIGRRGRQSHDLQKIQRNLPRPERVALIESVDGGDLCKMLRNSLALISASTMEGFDYPVLEAKAEGLPTLISDIPVHRELHENTSLTFGLDDDGSQLIKMVTQLTKDNKLWTHLSTKGYTMAKNMGLEQQRQQIREILTRVTPSLNWKTST